MTFYAESYFEQQQQLESMINYAIMVLLLILIVFNVSRYLRHRLHSRNRDLGIIFFLLLLIFTGLQITNLEHDYHQHAQTLQMRPFIQAVA